MMAAAATPLQIPLAGGTIPGLLDVPGSARACFVMAHGAGAGMAHPFMAAMAALLGARGIATLRYDFPYMARGARRPDSPAVAHAAVRAAVREAGERLPGMPLLAGGKSFGARMTSQAQADAPLPAVRGLVFVGFPLHPAGKPATERAAHLLQVDLPMLFLQGTRDKLAEADLLRRTVEGLAPRAGTVWIDGADHAFHVPARSGRSDHDVRCVLADAIATWAAGVLSA